MKPCLPPREHVTTPSWRSPEGGCDCHFHIFCPFDRYPLHPGRSYTPQREASVAEYRAMADTLGLSRGVVVQASIHGTDNRCTLASVAELGADRYRAVVVVDDTADAAALAAMHAAGARGVRFNAVSGNGTPLEQLALLARRIAPLGWHIQCYVHGEQLPELAPRLAALPVPVVIDHAGGVAPAKGLGHPEFQALLRLLGSGRAWVKLSFYRPSAGPPYADMQPQIRALIEAAPERCVWGTDWPHPSLERDMPDDGVLFDLLGEWMPEAATRRRILVDNPAALYGFEA
ncbi:MAG: amidohydrolase family protein [Acidisphaera sp.]|nr:amidohydrolase family protein [Acidisphaera sp.]